MHYPLLGRQHDLLSRLFFLRLLKWVHTSVHSSVHAYVDEIGDEFVNATTLTVYSDIFLFIGVYSDLRMCLSIGHCPYFNPLEKKLYIRKQNYTEACTL